MVIVLNDEFGDSLIAKLPEQSRSVIVTVQDVSKCHVCIRDNEGNDSHLPLSDYSK